MPTSLQWRQFYTLSYSSKGRKAAIVPIKIETNWIRIEVIVLTFPKPQWYTAGWINQVYTIQGKQHLSYSQVVPLQPSIFYFETEEIYQIRFKPVVYLPQSLVKFYRAVQP